MKFWQHRSGYFAVSNRSLFVGKFRLKAALESLLTNPIKLTATVGSRW
jgi:hypothetical protein